MLPTFFIIGAAKAGTTSLYRYLAEHPEIHMSPIKETNFFCADNGDFRYRTRIGEAAEYEALFDSRAACRGESSNSYSEYPRHRGVPKRIHEAVPDAKLIYLVRDPIERLKSLYMQAIASARKDRRFAGELSVEKVIGDIEDPTNEYICGGRYMTQIAQYMEVFPRSSLLVVDHADLLRNRFETLSRVFRFLGVDHTFVSAGITEQHNASAAKRRFTDAYVGLRYSPFKSAIDRLPAGLRAPLVGAAQRTLSRRPPAPEISDDDRRRLIELFAPEVDALRRVTGEQFSTWSM